MREAGISAAQELWVNPADFAERIFRLLYFGFIWEQLGNNKDQIRGKIGYLREA
jgi:hypothetical protein